MSDGPALGVVVPCRNEAAVIERKLRNLARAQWPQSARPHRIVVVDDGSEDDTAERAAAVPRGADTPVVDVVPNRGRPGKAGAINEGLARLEPLVDVVVLSDADVVVRPDALAALATAFATHPRLGMACGSQEFVVDLAEDGTPRGADGGEPVPAAGRYDRWTALVRKLESRRGRLFSVHGQLLAWRADLGIRPTPGIAADDLDLMRQVRARGLRVEKLDDASFLEVKTPPGADRRAQELRRARAYVQVVGLCRLPAGASWLDRAHFAAYRWMPLASPWLALVGAALAVLAAWLVAGGPGAAAAAVLVALTALSPPGRHLARLLAVIARAQRLESRQSLADRWEMARS